MRRITIFIAMLLLCALWAVPVCATEQTAEDITDSTYIYGYDEADYSLLTDGLETENVYTSSQLHLRNDMGIAGVYLVTEFPCTFSIKNANSGESVMQKEAGFLHVFTDVETLLGHVPSEIILEFPEGAWIAELRVFSQGEIPDTVQQWQPPLTGGADIVLFSTHGDDEQLYFAGLLPYYAGERNLDVQVVYMTGHSNICGSIRQHEMLNGLWAVGIRNYPVFGPFPDFKLMDRDETYAEYENLGFNREALLQFVVENLRQFRPQVAVGHDLNGEYGHGMHQVYADLLTKAVNVSGDADTFPESAVRYGTWDVPKTYLHLYPENEIVMDWDQPMERFDGMTAFEVTQKKGFPCHISQQYDLYVNWIYDGGNITQASQIQQWNPCYFGLYRSTVGEDVEKNDFMENLTSYGELSQQNEAQDQKLRDVLQTAQLRSKGEIKRLRPPEEPVAEVQKQVFPVFPALVVMCSAGAIAAIFIKIKKSEKNENNT